MRLPRRVDHGEFDVLDEGKKGCPSGPILSRLRGVGKHWCWGRHAQGGAQGFCCTADRLTIYGLL